jgi:hypothetical protein
MRKKNMLVLVKIIFVLFHDQNKLDSRECIKVSKLRLKRNLFEFEILN